MDEEPQLDARARRAIPLIAAALTVIVVAGLIYLRANTPPPTVLVGAPAVPHLAAGYSATYDFITPSLGWAGVVRQSGAATAWVFRTTDGARHWQRQFTATSSEADQPSLHFFDQKHGIFYAGRLYRTVDGGATWDVISLPEGTPNFTFASPVRGWALAYEADLSSTTHLYATVDGGLTWRMLNTTMPSLALVSGKGGYTSLDFSANGEGWSGSAGVTPTVLSSADSGASWHAITLPVPKVDAPPSGKAFVQEGPYYTTGVELLPGDGVLVLVDGNFGPPLFLTSFDRGTTWRSIQPPGPPAFSLSFVDSRHWWASGWGTLFKTSDAGQTWMEVRVDPTGIFGDWVFGPAKAIDSRHAWLQITAGEVGNGSTGLAMTSDGGVHWTAVNVPHAV